MDKKLLCILINYNTSQLTLNCLESIYMCDFNSYKDVVDIYVVDNSEETDQLLIDGLIDYKMVRYIKTPLNIGYFGAAHYAHDLYLTSNNSLPPWLIVSNVDVVFEGKEFFKTLFSTSYSVDIGVIAPLISSTYTGINLNPLMLNRPTSLKMMFYKIVFGFYLTCILYLNLSQLKARLQRNCYRVKLANRIFKKKVYVYAPYGSVLIFSKKFFDKGGTLNYPCFLFSEEIYIAEQARLLNLKVIYEPNIKILDIGHISTNMLPSLKKCRYMGDSAAYIYDTYFAKVNSR